MALVLLSTAGLALFDWINLNLGSAQRLQERRQVQRAEQLATAWGQTLPLPQQPQGRSDIEPGWELVWTSRPLTPMTSVAPFQGGTSTPCRVALYEVDLQVRAPALRPGGGPLARVTLTRTAVERDPSADTAALLPDQ